MRARLRELLRAHPGYGYQRLLPLLRAEGFLLNHKRLLRIYRQERRLPSVRATHRLYGQSGIVAVEDPASSESTLSHGALGRSADQPLSSPQSSSTSTTLVSPM